jgi:hypothetical protein
VKHDCTFVPSRGKELRMLEDAGVRVYLDETTDAAELCDRLAETERAGGISTRPADGFVVRRSSDRTRWL